MSDALNTVYDSVDDHFSDESAATRRKFVAGAAATVGGMGLLSLPTAAMAKNDAQTILNVARTAEVLATIVNTVGGEKLASQLDPVTKLNIQAAAREELIHHDVLTSLGGRPLPNGDTSKKLWVPDKVFASKEGLLNALVVGDQIFINAYLIGTTAFASQKQPEAARATGEFMGAEAVHRALARQSLGLLGNDRAFMRFSFSRIETAVTRLQEAGFGFGTQGRINGSIPPGQFYDFREVRKRTPDPSGVNTRTPK